MRVITRAKHCHISSSSEWCCHSRNSTLLKLSACDKMYVCRMDQKLGVISFDISESSCSKYYQNKMRVKNTVNKLKYLKQIVKNPKSLKIKKHLFLWISMYHAHSCVVTHCSIGDLKKCKDFHLWLWCTTMNAYGGFQLCSISRGMLEMMFQSNHSIFSALHVLVHGVCKGWLGTWIETHLNQNGVGTEITKCMTKQL